MMISRPLIRLIGAVIIWTAIAPRLAQAVGTTCGGFLALQYTSGPVFANPGEISNFIKNQC